MLDRALLAGCSRTLRLAAGMSVLHASVYAARRRVIPILITSFTTVAGLFSLATGLGGKSLLWGPVASAIMWGLGFATILTLFVIPLLYRMFMGRRAGQGKAGPRRRFFWIPGAAGFSRGRRKASSWP